MEAIDDNPGIGKEGLGDVAETLVHVHDDILDLVAVREGFEVILDAGNGSIGQDVKNALGQGIRDDALEFFSADVSFEFIEGDGRWKARGAHRWHVLEAAHNAADGGAGQGGDVL